MSFSIFNQATCGDYSFYEMLVEIDGIQCGVNESILANRGRNPDNESELKFTTTYHHEMTHLIDMINSVWGLDHCTRFSKWFDDEESIEHYILRLGSSVFSLHDHQTQINKSNEEYRRINVSLQYNQEYGAFIWMHFTDFREILWSTPLSMKSLLEGHAYSQETLMRYNFYSKKKDIVMMNKTESDLLKDLQNPKISEYTCVIAIAFQFFPNANIKEKLRAVIYSCQFSLNAPSLSMAMISFETIDYLFPKSPLEIKTSIYMDINRGEGRSSLLYATLASLCIGHERGEIKMTESFDEINDWLHIFLLGQASGADLINFSKIEIETYIRNLELIGMNLPTVFYENNGWVRFETDYSHLKLPDFVLMTQNDLSFKSFGPRLEYDMEDHYEKYNQPASKLNKLLNEKPLMRDHLHPTDSLRLYLDMRYFQKTLT